MKRHIMLSTYGITIEQFDRMLADQQQRCAICRRERGTGWSWNVDHCHDTGLVRGVLCPPCNAGMGGLRDDPALLRAAADYLERHR